VKSAARTAFVWVAWIFVACCVVQVFLAGLAVFESPARFADHRNFGYLFGLLTIVLIVLAIAGRLGRVVIGLSILLLVLFALQSVFVLMRTSAPFVAALHPVNGFLILFIGIVVARMAAARRQEDVSEPVPTTPEPSRAA
jgi:mercuric ion transport protein